MEGPANAGEDYADRYPPPDPRDVPAFIDFAVRLDEMVAEAKRLFFLCERVGDRISDAIDTAQDAAGERGDDYREDPEYNAARRHAQRWRELSWELEFFPPVTRARDF